MSQGNGQSVISLMDRIQVGMNGVTIPKFVPGAQKRDEDDKVLGHCDDFLKRLKSYHEQLGANAMPLQKEAKELERALIEAIGSLKQKTDAASLVLQLAGFSTPDLQAKAARLQEVAKELNPQVAYANFVGDLFWAEVRNRLPDTAGATGIALRADWSLVASERDDDDEHGHGLGDIISSMFGGRGRGPGPFVLRA